MITNPKGLLTILFTLQYSELVKRFQYQGKVKLYNEIDYNSLVAYAAKATNINESNIRMSMDAIFDAVQYFVTEGHGVELEGLGTFSFGIKCKAAFSESAAQSQLDGLRQKFINFLPALEIRKAMNSAKLVKEVDDRNNPETNIVLVNRASYYPDGNRSHKAYPIADNTQEILISNGALVRFEGANFKRGITPTLVVGADGASALLMRATFKEQIPNIEQYYVVGGVEGNLPIKNLRVVDSEGAEKFNFNGYINNGDPVIRAVDYGVNRLMVGANSLAGTGGLTRKLSVRGNNLAEVAVTLNDTPLLPTVLSSNLLEFEVAINTGDVLVVGESQYTITFTGVEMAIQTISANGVTVQNGGTSTIVPYMNYHFILDGENMYKLRESDIVGPEGTVIGNVVRSVRTVEFDARFAAAGTLRIGESFAITLTKVDQNIVWGAQMGATISNSIIDNKFVFKLPVTSGVPNVDNFYFVPKGLSDYSRILPSEHATITFDQEKKEVVFSFDIDHWLSAFQDGNMYAVISYRPTPSTTEYYFEALVL